MADRRRPAPRGSMTNGRKTQEKRISVNRKRKLELRMKAFGWLLTAFFVVIFYAIICACIGNRCLFDNTTVNGVDVGGKKTDEASLFVDRQLRTDYSDAGVKVRLEDTEYMMDVSGALDFNSIKALQEIQDKSHSFWRRGYGFLESKITGTNYEIYPSVKDKNVVKGAIEGSPIMKVDLTKDAGYTIEGSSLIVVKGQGRRVVDVDRLTESIVELMAKGAYEENIECPVKSIDVDIDTLHNSIYCEPQEPTLDPDRDYQLVESKDGVDFDVDEAKKTLAGAKEGDKVRIPLIYTKADMSTEEYRELLFRDEMGSCTTDVEGSDNRKTNVEMAAKYCNGTVLMPGESFSYNYGVGELTEERGFLPGPSYANGESVLDMGGGICQVSSTMYMACLYANLQIDERHCHPYPSSYVPAGFDATVAWGGCDFIFTNDTEYPIKITTTYDGYSTTCTIWGTITEPFSVELYSETIETEPYETKYELDKSLGKDEQVLDTVGIEGLTVQTYRRVYDEDGNVISDGPESISVYSKRDEVYKVGKLPKEEKKEKEQNKKSKSEEEASDSGKAENETQESEEE